MVKIEKRSDFNLLDSHYLIKRYIEYQYNLICKNFDCTDLKDIGAIFYLQDEYDLKSYGKVGLALSFDKAIYETSDLLTLDDGISKIIIFQVIYALTNDVAITVIFELNCLDEETKSCFLEDCTERTVYL